MTAIPGQRLCEIALAAIGAALVLLALGANQHWLDAHFLPSFLLPRRWYVALETTARVTLGALGLLLGVVMRTRLARLAAANARHAVPVAIAVVAAFVASDLVLDRMRASDAPWRDEEPLRRPDPRLGWTFVPARTARSTIGGREIEYVFDAAGYRVRRADEPVDPERPTILFTGESVMFGEGLTWEESIPARVAAITGVQSANLAVRGYANDQAYLRLAAELPRFRRPVAVVSLFMTTLFGRNLESNRPHLGPGLVWLPPVHRSSLESLARLLVFYHSVPVIDRGVAVTREVLQATADLARSRGAAPLLVVPQFGPEDATERRLRHRVLDGLDMPSVFVEIDPSWHLPWNQHPNAAADRVIAAAIADRLGARTHADFQHSAAGVRRPIVMNSPPSRPSVRIQPIWAIHASTLQSSTAGAKRSSGSSPKTVLGNERR